MTSVLNTNDVELKVQEPAVELDEIESVWEGGCRTKFKYQDREIF